MSDADWLLSVLEGTATDLAIIDPAIPLQLTCSEHAAPFRLSEVDFPLCSAVKSVERIVLIHDSTLSP